MPITTPTVATKLCGQALGEDGIWSCDREAHSDGAHAYHGSGGIVLLFRIDDPTKTARDHCQHCYQPITDQNRATGPCSALYCTDCIGPYLAAYKARNHCPNCGSSDTTMRNFNKVLREADVHCANCGTYIRSWDPN